MGDGILTDTSPLVPLLNIFSHSQNLHFLPLGIMIAGAACHAARFWSDGQNLRHQQQSFDDLRRKNPPKAPFKQKRLFVLL